MKRTQKLEFESEIFDLARATLDSVLGRTITDMLAKSSDEAIVTMKISINLTPTPDVDDLEEDDPANWTPIFDCDVSSQIKSSYKLSAPVEPAGHLLCDPDGNWHLIDGDPQMRLEDLEEE